MRIYILSIILLLINISCNSIINRAYNDAAAKYNGYFLANESIHEIENELLALNDENYDSLINLSYEIDSNRINGINKKKEDIIKKLSILIQRQEGSKYVYPSYALIGKARLLAQDINQAITTLKYVNSKTNDSYAKQMSLIILMRAYTQKKDYDSATEVYDFLKKQTIHKDLILEYHLYAHYLFKKMNDIEKLFNELLFIEKYAKKKNLINKVYFAIGQIYLLKKDYNLARDYFRKCLSNNPTFKMEFNAKIFYAKTLNKIEDSQVKKYFSKLLKDKKNIQNLDRIYYEIGLYDNNNKKFKDAIINFDLSSQKNINKKKLLFNTYLNIADIYYERINDYRSAKLYYDSALSNTNREHPYYNIIKSKTEVLNELVENLDVIRKNDSLIYLTTIPDTDLNEIIQNKISLDKKTQKTKKQSISQQNFFTDKPKIITNNNDGEWYFNNTSVVSLGINDFKRIWGNRELKDNWRLISKISFNSSISDLESEKEESEMDKLIKDKNENQSVDDLKSSLPFDKNEKIKLLYAIEEASYKVGKIYFQKLNEIKKGSKVYIDFIERFNSSKFLPEIYYQLYLIESDNEKYKKIILNNYQDTEYYKLIINPNYKINEFQELNFLKKEYNLLYESLKKENNDYVISKVDTLFNLYNKNPFFENLILLRSIGLGNKSGNFTLQFELKAFLKNSKNESSKNYGSTLLLSAENVHERFVYSGLPKFNNNKGSKYFFISITDEKDEKILSILNENSNKINESIDIFSFKLIDEVYFKALTYPDHKTLKQLEKEFNLQLDNEELKGNINFVVSEKNMNLIFKSKNYSEFYKFYIK